MRNRLSHGFTVLEVLLGMVITVILITVATPAFSQFLQRQQLRAAASELSATLRAARYHAVSHARTVQVCQIGRRKRTCQQPYPAWRSWSDGWITFDASETSAPQLININQIETDIGIIFNQRGRLRFFADGSARSAGFYLCSASLDEIMHLTLFHSGRLKVSTRHDTKQRHRCLRASGKID